MDAKAFAYNFEANNQKLVPQLCSFEFNLPNNLIDAFCTREY